MKKEFFNDNVALQTNKGLQYRKHKKRLRTYVSVSGIDKELVSLFVLFCLILFTYINV